MKARVIAWIIVLGVIYGAYTLVSSWKNPLTTNSLSPVTEMMPPMPKCGEKCT